MIRVGIIGGAGYTAGELCRILLNHPEAEVKFINSSSNAGNKITDVHEGLYGETDLVFTDQLPFDEVDVIFFCFGHGKSAEFLQAHDVPSRVKIIDLAQDFRLAAPGNDYVYGLPELDKGGHCRGAACGQSRLFCHLHPVGVVAFGCPRPVEWRRVGECHHGKYRCRGEARRDHALQLA